MKIHSSLGGTQLSLGRHSGLMVRVLDSGSSHGLGHHVVFLGKTRLLSVPLSIQVYKWVPKNLLLGVTLRWTSIPPKGEEEGGSRNTPSCYMLQPDRLLGLYETLSLPTASISPVLLWTEFLQIWVQCNTRNASCTSIHVILHVLS